MYSVFLKARLGEDVKLELSMDIDPEGSDKRSAVSRAYVVCHSCCLCYHRLCFFALVTQLDRVQLS